MDGDGTDHLSALSDDLLRRILHFVPFKEAASTSVLSRRWGSLWRSSGAVNLVVRVNPFPQKADAAFFSRRDALVAAAEDAVAGAEAPVTRLTVRLEGDDAAVVKFLRPAVVHPAVDLGHRVLTGYLHGPAVLSTVVSHPAARRVEELRIAAVDPSRDGMFRAGREIEKPVGVYSLGSLAASETLRVLDLTKCRELMVSPAAAFPRLATLRLSMCSVQAWDLQALLDAAPELATVHLESVYFAPLPPPPNYFPQLAPIPPPPPPPPMIHMPLPRPPPFLRPPPINFAPNFTRPPPLNFPRLQPLNFPRPPPLNFVRPPPMNFSPIPPLPPSVRPPPTAELPGPGVRLRCLAATELVLELCGFEGQRHYGESNGWAVEIDAPRLRCFRYKGLPRPFLLKSPAPDMARVDLYFLHDTYNPCHHGLCRYCTDEESRHTASTNLWKFVRNFTSARELKIKVKYLKDMAAIGKARRADLLCAPLFPAVVRLELEGAHSPRSTTAGVAIANLLRCCPGVRDLRLNLLPSHSHRSAGRPADHDPLHHNHNKSDYSRWDDYRESVDRFMIARCRSEAAAFKDGTSDNGECDEVPADIPGLSGRSFTCLRSSLRRVRLQFRLDRPATCLGVRLLKFFADNAMVLEEMCVDTGNRRLNQHMDLNVEKWIAADSSRAVLKRKNLIESSWEFSKRPRISKDSTTGLPMITRGGFTVGPLQR